MLNRRQLACLLLAAAVAILESVFLDTACNSPPGKNARKVQDGRSSENARGVTGTVWTCSNGSFSPAAGEKYLTYQPPGNGWNNQRQAMEMALVLAVLLKRTLIVHPMSPHELGLKLKRPKAASDGTLQSMTGFEAYNAVPADRLTPIGRLLDLEHMSRVSGVRVVEWCSTQRMLRQHLSQLRWRSICHSGGHGFWIDRFPAEGNANTVEMLQLQSFEPTGGWDTKCREEITFRQRRNWDEPLVRSVMELKEEDADILYISEGTLFGIDLRFTEKSQALTAQDMLLDAIRLEASIYRKAALVRARLQPFNGVHVRRGDHQLRNANSELWLKTMAECSLQAETKNLYVATDERSKAWFQPFRDAGYKLTFASDIEDILQTKRLPEESRQDVTGVYEQAVLVAASHFVPSPTSTFSAFVVRSRNETAKRDGMLLAGTRIKWAAHTIRV